MARLAVYPGNERRRLSLNALRAFEAAARCGSFTAGAEALSITQSALSRHVLTLERQLACRLFQRGSAGVQLTEAGEHLLDDVSKAFDRISGSISRLQPRHRLRLFLAPSFLQTMPPGMLQELRKDQQSLQLDLVTDNTVGQGKIPVDVAVTFEHLPLPKDHAGHLLWKIRLTPACRADLGPVIADGGLARAMEAHELLHVRIPGASAFRLWEDFTEAVDAGSVKAGGIVFETQAQALEYARSGGGIALVDSRMVPRLGEYGLCAPFDLQVPTDYGYVLSAMPKTDGDAVRSLHAGLLAIAG